MKSERLMENFRLEIQGPFASAGRCCPKKRGRGFKVVPNFDSRSAAKKASMVDDGVGSLVPELSLSASGSSESSGSSLEGGVPPVEILVDGGEVCEEEELNSLTCLSHGSISVIGRRRAMEDAVTVELGIVAGEFSFFAVYDGHGGSRVANACRDRLHQLLMNELKGRKSPENPTGIGVSGGGGVGVGIEWEKVMMACFAKMDDEVSGSNSARAKEGAGASVHANTVGSTAAVVMVGKDELVVANCGDSRVVLGRGGVAVPLSRDHKPDRPDERERVEARGGRVINWNGSRVLGVLATSRSIGDHYLKPYVIAEPEVMVSTRTELDNFLIIASDGLWDVVSNEVACNVVRRCLDGQMRKRFSEGTAATEAAAMLAGLAMARGSTDNISVVVVEL